jgi:O-antigen/teichoic acid export membrane protein
MNTTTIFHSFSSALTANALLHLFSKVFSTMITFIVYSTASTNDFATWATIMSTIFLVLLWLDGGLRKSIPRYAPEFSTIQRHLLFPLLQLQLILLILASPLMLYFLARITSNCYLIILALSIYVLEGITSCLRSLYHAYFYHHFFNQQTAYATTTETVLTLAAVAMVPATHLITALLAAKLISTCMIATIAITGWQQQPSALFIAESIPKNYHHFIRHTVWMWGMTIATSISERNFLLPFIAYATNMHTTALFKVSHDAALLLYRFIIKTIGSTDTALLAHVYIYNKDRISSDNLMQQSVQKLSTQIARLALPLIGILIATVPAGYWFYYDSVGFHAFLIMAIGYLLETIWIPYERVLEVHHKYKILFYVYLLYIISITMTFFLFYISWIGLCIFLMCIHGVRLVIGILMRYSVYRLYGI